MNEWMNILIGTVPLSLPRTSLHSLRKYCQKVKVHTLDIAPLRSESPPQKRSGMARVLLLLRCGLVAKWLGSRTCHQQVAGSNPGRRAAEWNPEQVVYTHVRLSLSSIIWSGQWAVGKVSTGVAESNGSLPPGLWLRSPVGWLPRTGISSGTLYACFEYGTIFTTFS